MKKLLLVLAIGAFAACGSGSGDATSSDTTSTTTDSATMAPAAGDTSHASDTSSMKMGDSSSMKKDTTKM